MEVFLDNVALPVDIGDRDKITQMGLIADPLLRLAGDDNINATHPRVRRVLLSNPVAWVKETGTARANGPNSAKPLCRHHRRIEFMSSLPKRWYKNYVFLRRYATTTSQPHFFIFFCATMKLMGCAPTSISSRQLKINLTPVWLGSASLLSTEVSTGSRRLDHFPCRCGSLSALPFGNAITIW